MKNHFRLFNASMMSLFMVFQCVKINAQNIELTIKGIRSTKGTLQIGVFKDNEIDFLFNRKSELVNKMLNDL